MGKMPKNEQGPGKKGSSAGAPEVGLRAGGPAYRVVVVCPREMDEGSGSAAAAVSAAARAAAERFCRCKINLPAVMVFVVPNEARAAFASPRGAWPEKSVPYRLAVRHGTDKIVYLTFGTADLGPGLLEAVVAHEFAHIALGHCGESGNFAWWFGAAYLRRELAADRLVVRVGCGSELLEALRRLERRGRTLEGTVRMCGLAFRLLLRRTGRALRIRKRRGLEEKGRCAS